VQGLSWLVQSTIHFIFKESLEPQGSAQWTSIGQNLAKAMCVLSSYDGFLGPLTPFRSAFHAHQARRVLACKGQKAYYVFKLHLGCDLASFLYNGFSLYARRQLCGTAVVQWIHQTRLGQPSVFDIVPQPSWKFTLVQLLTGLKHGGSGHGNSAREPQQAGFVRLQLTAVHRLHSHWSQASAMPSVSSGSRTTQSSSKGNTDLSPPDVYTLKTSS
jgi:hypothetical protein